MNYKEMTVAEFVKWSNECGIHVQEITEEAEAAFEKSEKYNNSKPQRQ